MTSVRFVFPKPRLNELLRAPGGLAVADAVERAQANLDALRPSCMADMAALLDLCEARFQDLGGDPAGVQDLYAIAVKGIGAGAVCGLPALDTALTSFCDLLDHLRTLGRADAEPIAVHVQSWRLLMDPALPEAANAQIVEGLLKVSRRYSAEAKSAAGAAG